MANFGDRYELIRRIGAGGMGEVWLAHDEELASRPVAIKIMHRDVLPDESDVARFERELRFAAMMDHPNIVTVYATGTRDDTPFMVMEYLQGHDLEKEPAGAGAERIAGIGRDICSGLGYAHREGVLHRDIKPGNLFLCDSGQVKITDFGIARAVSGTTLSTAGILVGTFAYLPPERWRGEPPTFSNDVWAVGCVLYRLISGRLPRTLPSAADYAAAAVRGDPFPDLSVITDAPGWLTDPVMAMLAADPASRPTAGDCVQLLSGAQFPPPVPARLAPAPPARAEPAQPEPSPAAAPLGELAAASVAGPAATPTNAVPPTAVQPAAGQPAGGRSRRRNRVLLAAGGLALLLLLAGSVTAWRLSGSPRTADLVVPGTGTSAPAGGGAAKAPAASAAASRTGSGPGSAPVSGPASVTASRSPAPAGSRPAGAAPSPSASPVSSPTATPVSSPVSSPVPSGSPPPASSAPATPVSSPPATPVSSPPGGTPPPTPPPGGTPPPGPPGGTPPPGPPPAG